MVDKDVKSTQDFLSNLGLNPQEVTLYLTLITKGPLSILELARQSRIPRSTCYRLLENLKSQQLVEEIVDEHRTLAQAVPPDRLKSLLKAKQVQIAGLTNLFPEVQTYLNQQIHRRQSDTQVKFYRGPEGIKQMAENVLSAQKEIVGFTYFTWKSAVGDKYALYFFEEMARLKLTMREIFSDSYIASKGGLQNLSIPEVPPRFSHIFTSRYLSKDKLDIQAQTDIYNDVVTFYSWHQDEIFGVEIRNAKVAAMQKQIFEILWQQATPESELIKRQ